MWDGWIHDLLLPLEEAKPIGLYPSGRVVLVHQNDFCTVLYLAAGCIYWSCSMILCLSKLFFHNSVNNLVFSEWALAPFQYGHPICYSWKIFPILTLKFGCKIWCLNFQGLHLLKAKLIFFFFFAGHSLLVHMKWLLHLVFRFLFITPLIVIMNVSVRPCVSFDLFYC